MDEKEYILFCDESERSGKFYSNFYGGVMVASSVYEPATQALNDLKRELNLFGEVKWEKVTERYLDRYVRLIKLFFHAHAARRHPPPRHVPTKCQRANRLDP